MCAPCKHFLADVVTLLIKLNGASMSPEIRNQVYKLTCKLPPLEEYITNREAEALERSKITYRKEFSNEKA